MTEQLAKARADVAKAIQAKIIEIMAAAVSEASAEIADAVLNECSSPFDAAALAETIASELGSWDFTPYLGNCG